MKEIDLINLQADLQEQAFSLFDQGKDKEASECMLKSAELGDVVSQYYAYSKAVLVTLVLCMLTLRKLKRSKSSTAL